jgi:glucosamine kinase
MYSIITDSGSTKTDWVLCQGRKIIKRVKTIGFNPYFQTRAQVSKVISDEVRPVFSAELDKVDSIHYYGTGCSTEANCSLIRGAIADALQVRDIRVAHDLLAAARALCGREKGIAAILGTGSNSGLYDGVNIVENVPSTGYLWSDYGGGSQIGKFIIREYFEQRMPGDLREAFESEGYSREVILDNVYKGSMPARYLASVSLFAARHTNHPVIQRVLEECFDSFFEQQVKKYTDSRNYTVNTIGSVGFFYRDLFIEVARRHGYVTGKMIQSPMEGLLEFHSP